MGGTQIQTTFNSNFFYQHTFKFFVSKQIFTFLFYLVKKYQFLKIDNQFYLFSRTYILSQWYLPKSNDKSEILKGRIFIFYLKLCVTNK